ncbi:MAG: phage holin family protein [Chloroflexi bacterium]|nr:phage holin family protein [Chloroflexota bacterium]
MSAQETDEPRLSAFALARRLVSGLVALARLEVQHGLQEVGGMLAQARGAMLLFGIALGLVFAALISFTVFFILLIAALLGWPGWLVSLIVTFLLLGIAGFLGWRGVRKVKFGPPEETMASVREEVAWAKRLIRRG